MLDLAIILQLEIMRFTNGLEMGDEGEKRMKDGF